MSRVAAGPEPLADAEVVLDTASAFAALTSLES
jgi:hypothetical protein